MKKTMTSLLAAAFLLGGTLITAAPAQAASCGSGQVCLWRDAGHSGTKWTWNGSASWVGSGANDQASSYILGAQNHRSYPYHMFYDNVNYGGSRFYDKKGKGVRNLKQVAYPGGGNWNDKISSHQVATAN